MSRNFLGGKDCMKKNGRKHSNQVSLSKKLFESAHCIEGLIFMQGIKTRRIAGKVARGGRTKRSLSIICVYSGPESFSGKLRSPLWQD